MLACKALQKGHFLESLSHARMVHDDLSERGLLSQHLVPHLLAELPFLLPTPTRRSRVEAWIGTSLNDLKSFGGGVCAQRRVSKAGFAERMPGLRPTKATEYPDGQLVSDSRYVSDVERTAAAEPASPVLATALG